MNIKTLSSIIVSISAAVLFSACGSDSDNYYFEQEEEGDITAFYGDKLNDRVVIMDVNTMTQKTSVYTHGVDPYPVDRAGKLDKLYAITRSSNSIDVIDSNTYEPKGLINLSHFPRSSEAYNTTLGLQYVTGADKPMGSLINVNTDTVVSTVGLNAIFTGVTGDYGGGNATGHPFWFNDSQFALIDRPNRMIHVYTVTKDSGGAYVSTLLNSIATPTAVHHFVKRDNSDNLFYAIAEGNTLTTAPTIVKYELTATALNQISSVALSGAGATLADMGSHHADIHPDGVHIYVGSNEGNLYVVDSSTMSITNIIPTGAGTGHTTFVPDRGIAVVTNHKDTFVTIIDITNHTFIKNVTVSGASIHGEILQSHSTFVHPNMDDFYAFATDNGIFYELDLDKLEVSRTVETGGTPLQGSFICEDGDCASLM